jgi:hypothetical protein
VSKPEDLYFGLKFYELLTLIGVILAPVIAVLVSLWIDGCRKEREQKLSILRMLIATRHLPADPSFFTAVNLIPIEFSNNRDVMTAYRDFMNAVAAEVIDDNAQKVGENTALKTVRLIYQVAKDLGFPLRETDLQTDGYVSRGFGTRDGLLLDSQRAMRDIATHLMLQTRLLANAPLGPEERRYLGLPDA